MAPEKKDAPTAEDRMESLITQLVQGLKDAAVKPEQIKEIVESVAISTQKAMRPENPDFHGISVYAPKGKGDKAEHKLSRKTFFCGREEEEDRLTPQEIAAYNAISEPKRMRGGSWRAEIRLARNVGGKDELYIWVPANTIDQRMMLPGSLTLLLHELNGGPSTENVMELLKQIDALKAMLLTKGSTATELESALLSA